MTSKFLLSLAVIFIVLFTTNHAFIKSFGLITKCHTFRLSMADVEITFPNKKKVKAATGSSLKDAAKKAGFSPNYGCEEGKCGSCELKISGKKIRPCTAKVRFFCSTISLQIISIILPYCD